MISFKLYLAVIIIILSISLLAYLLRLDITLNPISVFKPLELNKKELIIVFIPPHSTNAIEDLRLIILNNMIYFGYLPSYTFSLDSTLPPEL